MNANSILETMNRQQVDYLLIGGMNFLLRHRGALTYDVDLWIDDTDENRARCEAALAELQAEWADSDEVWGPVANLRPGWLERKGVFCINSPHGALDIFRTVTSLGKWSDSAASAAWEQTGQGTNYRGL